MAERKRLLDGVFIAARRDLLSAIQFDTAIPGFHYYDVDLSYRAYLSGARVAVASDLTLFHKSKGSYDQNWFQSKEYFARKFPQLNGTPGNAHHYYKRPFFDRKMFLSLSQAFNEAMI